MSDEKPYPLPMLPDVNYQQFEDDLFDSLVDLEYGVLENLRSFLEGFKKILLDENLMQVPELIVAQMCAYLGALTVVCVGADQAAFLEEPISILLKKHANLAHVAFNQHPVNSTVKAEHIKSENINKVRDSAPGSIVVQTVRLGRFIMDLMSELSNNRDDKLGFSRQKQKELFCSQDKFADFLIPLVQKQHQEWVEFLSGQSIHHPINQVAIQIGWIIGYFSHLDKKTPEEGAYVEFGVPCIAMHIDYTGKHIEALNRAKYRKAAEGEQSAGENSILNDPLVKSLLTEVGALSQKVHTEQAPVTTKFQKKTVIADAAIQKAVIDLVMEEMPPKAIIMSLYYFWFTLDARLHGVSDKSLEGYSPFDEFGNIIQLIKKTVSQLPEPKLTPDIKALNAKMEQLKSVYPDPTDYDKVPEDNVEYYTKKVNAVIHTITSDYMKQNYHPEIIANILFNNWLRTYLLFAGAAESDWQKMDYYFEEILTKVRDYLPMIFK